MTLTVLTWNLFHGRGEPPGGRPLLGPFASALAGWDWDVALLQEVPPWWPPALASATRAEWRAVLTSRNSLLPARRAVAARAPDLLKANGGGANAILARRPISAHAWCRLCVWPERRFVHAVALEGGAVWVANLHASTHPPARTARDVARAATTLERWSAGAPAAVLAGDLNLRDPRVPGYAVLGSHHVDHVLARGVRVEGDAEVLEHGALSDHAPLRVRVSGGA